MSLFEKATPANWGEIVFNRNKRSNQTFIDIKVDSLQHINTLYQSGELKYPDISISDIDGVGVPTIGELLLGIKSRVRSGQQLRQWARIERRAGIVIVFSSRISRQKGGPGISNFPFIGEEEKERLAHLFRKTPDKDFFYIGKSLVRPRMAIAQVQKVIERVKEVKPEATVHFLGSSPLDFKLAQQLDMDIFLSTHHLFI